MWPVFRAEDCFLFWDLSDGVCPLNFNNFLCGGGSPGSKQLRCVKFKVHMMQSCIYRVREWTGKKGTEKKEVKNERGGNRLVPVAQIDRDVF
jgi:hypothetical protein